MLDEVQKQWFGHGALMILATLLGGIGLWLYQAGGFVIFPGWQIPFQMPGTAAGWAHAHTGPVMNGLMVIGVALMMPALGFTERKAKILGWLVVADGWSNVIFYFFANIAPNHGLSFSANHYGPASIYGDIALAPAFLFGGIAIVVFAIIGWQGVRVLRQE